MFRWLLFLFAICSCFTSYSQDSPPLTSAERDSIRFTNLKTRFYKRKTTKAIYKLFFKDVYNRKKASSEVKAIEVNPFLPYEGKTIRAITFRQLNAIGQSVHDTTRQSNKIQTILSENLHVNTKEPLLRRSYLLIKEGDTIDPDKLIENERILRQSSVILDARIHLTSNEDETVDVLIITQDVWALKPKVSFSSFNNFGLGLVNNNVRGTGHASDIGFRWRQNDTLQKFTFRGVYTIPYLQKTFISTQMGFIWERDLKQQFFRMSRPFITVQSKWAGSAEMGFKTVREFKKTYDNIELTDIYNVRNRYYDAWLGRSFRLFSNTKRIVTAARINQYVYTDRPFVSADSNMIYWNSKATLFSIGYSDRNYKRDVLIYGFGRTEDVPIGLMFAITGGKDASEFGDRGYAGIQLTRGKYIGKLGYLNLSTNAGTYLKNGNLQQSILNLGGNYFSPLMNIGLSQVRTFLNFHYTRGFRMDPLQYINVTDELGIRGIHSDRLIGKRRLNVSSEVVLFSPGSFFGFRAATFAYVDLGLINNHKKLWQGTLYQSYALGIRLRNEHLTFNTIELRLCYYPNIPMTNTNTNRLRFDVQGVQNLRLPDFDISAPSITPFR